MDLKRFLKDNGLKQNWLAKQLGINHSTLWRWLQRDSLSEKQEKRILEVLRIDYNQANKSAQSK